MHTMTMSMCKPKVPGVLEERMAETGASSLCLRLTGGRFIMYARLLGDSQTKAQALDLIGRSLDGQEKCCWVFR
jgi:hypothetical protein